MFHLTDASHAIVLSHEIVGDVLLLHSQKPGAMIQAASQFNCLEFASPEVTPEDGVSRYERDPTQGPACAIACGAGTVFRNYFVPVAAARGDFQLGQTKDLQINNLDLLERRLLNDRHHYWTVVNGYTFPGSVDGLEELNRVLHSKSAEEMHDLMGDIKIGLHEDVVCPFQSVSSHRAPS